MGLFDKKCCSICGNPIGFLQSNKISDGFYCNTCKAQLSPFHCKSKNDTVSSIKYEIACCKKNQEKLELFSPTQVFGESVKLYVDNLKLQFVISATGDYLAEHADVINFSDVRNVCTEVSESKNEIKFRDSNGGINSFTPRCFAHSYSFYAIIDTKIPYINRIKIKLNAQPIDNGQPMIIEMGQNGIINRVVDRLYKGKSYNGGKSSNTNEVMSSIEYRKYKIMSDNIVQVLTQVPKAPPYVKCPWCGSNILRTLAYCNNCGAPINQ